MSLLLCNNSVTTATCLCLDRFGPHCSASSSVVWTNPHFCHVTPYLIPPLLIYTRRPSEIASRSTFCHSVYSRACFQSLGFPLRRFNTADKRTRSPKVTARLSRRCQVETTCNFRISDRQRERLGSARRRACLILAEKSFKTMFNVRAEAAGLPLLARRCGRKRSAAAKSGETLRLMPGATPTARPLRPRTAKSTMRLLHAW